MLGCIVSTHTHTHTVEVLCYYITRGNNNNNYTIIFFGPSLLALIRKCIMKRKEEGWGGRGEGSNASLTIYWERMRS